MNFFNRNFLFIIVFITGAAVLIVEVTATRILAPYFGNTLFTVSSIIGIVLGALSLGYYLGGVVADKRPKFNLFFFLILLGGIFCLLTYGLSKTILPGLGHSLGIKIGPPVSSLVLFFGPSLVLGMMSPFAIKLKSLQSKQIGTVSGLVFFWSTLGSIAGSFTAGFLLIPRLGIDQIIISVGFILIAIGVLGMWKFRKEGFNLRKSNLLIVLILFLFSLVFLSWSPSKSVLFQKDGVYSQILVKDTKINNKKARVLYQDRAMEGGVFLNSDQTPFDYTKYHKLYKIINPGIEKALVLGGGPYSIPQRILSQAKHIQRVDVAEIEPLLFPIAKKYFKLEPDPRLFNHVADGRSFLRGTNRDYDLIFGDAYGSFYSIPFHMTTQEFFGLVKQRLSKNGIFIMNIIGALDSKANSFLLSEIKTFSSVFENSYFFAVDSPNQNKLQNFILLGLNNKGHHQILEKELASPTNSLNLNLAKKRIHISDLDLDSAFILTDNFAPVEYLATEMIDFYK